MIKINPHKVENGGYFLNTKKGLILNIIIISGIFVQTSIACANAESYILTKVGQFDNCYFAFDVHVTENLAVIGDAGGGVWLLDVSNPTNPIELAHILGEGVDHSVYIQNDILFVADWSNGLRIFNISNQASPQHIGQFTNGQDVGFVTSENDIACISDPFLSLINISDLTNPTELYRSTDQSLIDGVIRDDVLFCLDLFSGLIVFNISDPTAPAEINQWITSSILYYELEIIEDVAFFTSSAGIKVLDISDLANLQVITTNIGPSETKGLGIENNLLYVSEPDAVVKIFNISNLNAIEEVGQYTNDDITINSIFVQDGLIYATAEGDGLIIIDKESGTSTNSINSISIFIEVVVLSALSLVFRRKKRSLQN